MTDASRGVPRNLFQNQKPLQEAKMKAMINRARGCATIGVICVSTFIAGLAAINMLEWRSFARSDSDKPLLSKPSRQANARIHEAYGKLPMRFEVNQGQAGAGAAFLSRGAGYSLFLTRYEAALQLRDVTQGANSISTISLISPIRSAPSVLRMKLVKANRKPRISGFERLETTSNYFVGNDPNKWRTNIANFAKVKYEAVYPGVDVIWYGNEGRLEHDFIVAPGADPNRIEVSFAGADAMAIGGEGAMSLRVGGEEVRLLKPVAWQEADGKRREIACDYRVVKKNRIGLRLGDYDAKLPLVIDPVLVYSTYIGGAGADIGL